MKIIALLFTVMALIGYGILNPHNLNSSKLNYDYPKASDDATIVYNLQSNKPNAMYWIDGKYMGKAKLLKVYINNSSHTITVKPDNCDKKEEFIQPPYSSISRLGFTYLKGECK